uniref:Uncharacterized protein n=2 Tax=Rhynchosporium TaxID=38037 RepID=V5W634_9HELO|nr:hypothetical protein [Rhynchosporium agropyri]AHC02320.1 hypothetical protein [Rhynchosporium agropyri]
MFNFLKPFIVKIPLFILLYMLISVFIPYCYPEYSKGVYLTLFSTFMSYKLFLFICSASYNYISNKVLDKFRSSSYHKVWLRSRRYIICIYKGKAADKSPVETYLFVLRFIRFILKPLFYENSYIELMKKSNNISEELRAITNEMNKPDNRDDLKVKFRDKYTEHIEISRKLLKYTKNM